MKKRLCSLLIAIIMVLSLMPANALAVEDGDVAGGEETVSKTANEEVITTEGQLLELLNDTGTKTGNYRLDDNFTIDTNNLRTDALPEGQKYVFKGNLNGNGKTITVKAVDGGSAPLFDTLRGSVHDLNVVFEGDVKGTTIAYDIGYEEEDQKLQLSDLSVTVKGDVLYDDHNYLDYYGKILTGDSNYGNWYIHFGGQPVNLATGFAWYIWGASLSDITVSVQGNIGTSQEMDGDTTSAGFAYFAVQGGAVDKRDYKDIVITVTGDIQSYTDKGHASAYGFAVGTNDSTAGFGCNTLEEITNVSVAAKNIIASSQKGASSAIGFARLMQGYTHDCSVNVSGKIEAYNKEGDQEEQKYSYMNGEAYAYGFMLNTGG